MKAKPGGRSYRPEQKLCGTCGQKLKRDHIAWRKRVIFSWGVEQVTSWGYKCADKECVGGEKTYISQAAERLHLKHRRYSRELVVKIGYRRFWEYRTLSELHAWLRESLKVAVTERQVLNLIGDFLALLRAGQGAKVAQKLSELREVVIGIDGMQPEKGNKMLYVVREPRIGLTLLAESLDEGGHGVLSKALLEPLKELIDQRDLAWRGVVSDGQASIRLAVTKTLPTVPYQACQSHCLREAGRLTFEADRRLKKELKSSFRWTLKRLRQRIQALADTDPHRAILLAYAEALHATLLSGGTAPFDLGGLWLFSALEDLALSLQRCQKKGITPFCNG